MSAPIRAHGPAMAPLNRPWHPFALLLFAALMAGASCRSGEARAEDSWTEPIAGIRYLLRSTDTPIRFHAVIVDLCGPGTTARATAPGEGPSTVSAFADQVGADVAINGDFFEENHIPLGLAIGSSRRWPQTRDLKAYSVIAFEEDRVFMPLTEERIDGWLDQVDQVVGGRPMLVRDGGNVAPTRGGLCGNRHPRTAVGISEDGRNLILAVVDGRSAASRGSNCRDLGDFMIELGAHQALNMDGGGSSALWIRGLGVVNQPSDGFERPVANHLALRVPGEGRPAHCPDQSHDGSDETGDEVAENASPETKAESDEP